MMRSCHTSVTQHFDEGTCYAISGPLWASDNFILHVLVSKLMSSKQDAGITSTSSNVTKYHYPDFLRLFSSSSSALLEYLRHRRDVLHRSINLLTRLTAIIYRFLFSVTSSLDSSLTPSLEAEGCQTD